MDIDDNTLLINKTDQKERQLLRKTNKYLHYAT